MSKMNESVEKLVEAGNEVGWNRRVVEGMIDKFGEEFTTDVILISEKSQGPITNNKAQEYVSYAAWKNITSFVGVKWIGPIGKKEGKILFVLDGPGQRGYVLSQKFMAEGELVSPRVEKGEWRVIIFPNDRQERVTDIKKLATELDLPIKDLKAACTTAIKEILYSGRPGWIKIKDVYSKTGDAEIDSYLGRLFGQGDVQEIFDYLF
jgi:hypothetical protein